MEAIRKVTQAPIKYHLYTTSLRPHRRRKPFKDRARRSCAPARKRALEVLQDPATPLPTKRSARRRRSRSAAPRSSALPGAESLDSTFIAAAEERIIFAVDLIRWARCPARDDRFLSARVGRQPQESARLDWDRLIPGHPAHRTARSAQGRRKTTLKFLQELRRR